MKYILFKERDDWREIADEAGFSFHSPNGEIYWDETHAYSFTLNEIESIIEDPTQELENMCLDLVSKVVDSEEYLTQLKIPEIAWNKIRNSWYSSEKNLYGRFDLSYSGDMTPAKMLEYNADTPTSLYESAAFQWWWLESRKELGQLKTADQYNSIEEKLVSAFQLMDFNSPVHFTGVFDSIEDKCTVTYLKKLSERAGLDSKLINISDIGISLDNCFTDLEDNEIINLFKLYPWEWIIHEDYGLKLLNSNVRVIEPIWKMVLSNKGILPLLWKHNTNHPNLLPSFFENDIEGLATLNGSYVKKPILSREGANIQLFKDGYLRAESDGEYGSEGNIIQKLHPLPDYNESHVVIGSWVVASVACGLGIREDASLITGNMSRFVPHFIE